MDQPRLSVGRLMGLVAFVAASLGLLRYPCPLGASVAFTLVLVLSIAALIGGFVSTGYDRARRLGFAIACLAYISIGFNECGYLETGWPARGWPERNHEGAVVPPHSTPVLATSFLLDAVYPILVVDRGPLVHGFITADGQPHSPRDVWNDWIAPDVGSSSTSLHASPSFRAGGHSLFALIAGGLGAILGTRLAARRVADRSGPSVPGAPPCPHSPPRP